MEPFMDFILKHGDWFFGRAEVQDYELTAAWKKRRKPKAGECFYNAQKFCMDHREHAYWEGYYLIRGLPMHHAWVVLDDGKVVDFTHEEALKKAKTDHEDDDPIPLYLGVNVPRRFILEHVLEGGNGEPIAERYAATTKLRRKRS